MDPFWDQLLRRLERDLAVRVRAGVGVARDDEAWEELERHLRRCAEALRRGGAAGSDLDEVDLEDTVQGLLLKFQSREQLHRVRSSRSPTGYLFVVVRNALRDITRSRRFEVAFDERLTEAVELVPELVDDGAHATRLAVLRRGMAALTAEEQNLLRMRFWLELPIGGIAARLGIRYSAAAVRLFRLLRRLRELPGLSL